MRGQRGGTDICKARWPHYIGRAEHGSMVDSEELDQANFVIRIIRQIGAVAIFTAHAILLAFRPPVYPRETLRLTKDLVVQCLVPVVTVMLPIGMIIALQGMSILRLFGAPSLLGSVLTLSVFRELAPGLSGIMVAAQAGSSIAAELGSMRTGEEIDAIEASGVHPVQLLIVPRMVALTCAGLLIHSMACLAGIGGGYVVAVGVKGLNHGVFMANLFAKVGLFDVWSGLVKAAVFGFTIAVISCYKGFNVRGGAVEVGRATNEAVVYSIVIFLGLNYLLSSAMFGTLR